MRFSFLSIQIELLNFFDGDFGFKENKHKSISSQKRICRCAFPKGTRIYQNSVDISGLIPLSHAPVAVSILNRGFFLC